MMKLLKVLFFVLSSALFISCGDSPLLNHEEESKSTSSNTEGLGTSKSYFTIEGQRVSVKLSWTMGPFPSPSKESKVLINLLDTQGNLYSLPENYTLELWGFMPSMGHGTAYDGYIEKQGPGTYMNFELFFNMPGDWEINLDLYNDSTKVDTLKHSFYM